jgi:hypothetical protein
MECAMGPEQAKSHCVSGWERVKFISFPVMEQNGEKAPEFLGYAYIS